MAQKKKPRRFATTQQRSLKPYGELADECQRRGWQLTLDWGRVGWVLQVKEDGMVISQAKVAEPVPLVFAQLATTAIRVLDKTGKLK